MENEIKKEEIKKTSSNPKVESILPGWSWFVLIGLCIILLMVGNFKSCNKNDEGKNEPSLSKRTGSETTYSPDKTPSLSDTIIRVYHLNSGPKIRVYTLEGYNYDRSSGGWKYYCTPQNGEKRIRGDGTSVDDGNDIAFFDLEFYEVECDIVVTYTKK